MAQRIRWIALCIGLLLIGAGFGFAQAVPPQTTPPINPLSGSDVGFQVTGRHNGMVRGYFMAHINGQWVPIETVLPPGASRIQPLSMR